MATKKMAFSAIQPSGGITLGNYLGALKNWVEVQESYRCVYSVADLHCVTVRQTAAGLRKRRLETMGVLLAIGIDSETGIVFQQSDVSAHAELAWMINCNTYFGELSRMTQFKVKSARHADNINAGLFTYPCLMAADILLYQADVVPVGADQKQHVEIARDVAVRFNNAYGETFVVPKPLIPDVGARIMSLQDPKKKMSKSDENENAYIMLLDPMDVIRRKIRRAVTDSDGHVSYSKQKPGVSNLLNIYAACKDIKPKQAEKDFAGLGYSQLKEGVYDAVVSMVTPIRERYDAIMADKEALKKIAAEGAEKAGSIAEKTLGKVYKKVGLR